MYDIEVVRWTKGDATAPSVVAGPPAVEVIVDGIPIEGTRIPLPQPGTARLKVEVRLS